MKLNVRIGATIRNRMDLEDLREQVAYWLQDIERQLKFYEEESRNGTKCNCKSTDCETKTIKPN